MQLFKPVVLIAAWCLLSACASTSAVNKVTQAPAFNRSLFKPETVISTAEITYLGEEQKDAFFEFYNNPKFALTPKHVRVATYLGILLDQFSYSEKTYTAQQALEAKGGNCLSLTVLTTAFAQLAGVDISYQLLEQNPVYSISNNVLITSDHLRAVVTERQVSETGFDIVSGIRVDYFDTDGLSYVDNISVTAQLSMFYSNIAAEALLDSNYDRAFAHANQALTLYADNASALNTVGILHRKLGDESSAEKIYEYGARNFSKAAMFVRNYASLLHGQARESDVKALLKSVDSNVQDHPWQWVRAGQAEYQAGDYASALNYYKRAIKLAPDLHQVYLFAGRASYAIGDKAASKRYLTQALKLAQDAQSRRSYKQKLYALKSRAVE